MVARAGRRYSCLVVVCAGLLSLADAVCQKPDLPENALVVPLLMDVNLTCPDCEGQVSWSRPNQTIKTQHSGHLFLKSVNYSDEDTYTCHRGSTTICSVKLLVRDEIEKPEIFCFLRHPIHNITCEWSPSKKLHPHANVTLIAWSLKGNHEVNSCSYIPSSRKFICSSLYHEGDTGPHTLSLCITTWTGHQISNTVDQSVDDLLQPDPPLSVRITPMENHPRWLNVFWLPPKLWQDNHYKLEYEVQYWVAYSQHVSNGTTTDTHFVIKDALARQRHAVRVRAKEEFHNTWSTWSKEATGIPWSEEEAEALGTVDPAEDYDPITSYKEYEYPDNREPKNSKAIPRYVWIVSSITFTVIFFLILGIFMKYSDTKLLRLKGSLLRSLFQRPQKLYSTPPLNATLLTSPFPLQWG